MGILAMSRAIGDLFLKPYVSATPDVREMPLGPSDEFLVLASDGVFDVFDNDQVGGGAGVKLE
jgi:serine/threonine protein phosphatase PrpC